MQHAVTEVIVYLHLRILGKLKSIRLKSLVIQAGENHRQAIAYHIIQIHQETFSLLIRKTYKTTALSNRKRYQCIIETFLSGSLHLDTQVDILIRLIGQLLNGREPHRTDKTAQSLAIESADKLLLLFIQFIFFQQIDILFTQFTGQLMNGLFVLF